MEEIKFVETKCSECLFEKRCEGTAENTTDLEYFCRNHKDKCFLEKGKVNPKFTTEMKSPYESVECDKPFLAHFPISNTFEVVQLYSRAGNNQLLDNVGGYIGDLDEIDMWCELPGVN